MATRSRPIYEAAMHASRQLSEIGGALRVARRVRGLTIEEVARRLETSSSRISRVERGGVATVSHVFLSRHAAAVGLKLSARLYPATRVVLDAGQLALLHRLREAVGDGWSWRTEVPMPIPGDLRAADALLVNEGCRIVAELWTRFLDGQAQSRSLLLKQRDLGVDRALLVIADTNANRRALREARGALSGSFPLDTKAVLRALRRGRDPGANGIVVI